MQNGEIVEYSSHCPVHGGKEKRVYGYGRFSKAPNPNASVVIYEGCKCSVCIVGTSLKKMYFDSYEGGAGEARFQCARLDEWG